MFVMHGGVGLFLSQILKICFCVKHKWLFSMHDIISIDFAVKPCVRTMVLNKVCVDFCVCLRFVMFGCVGGIFFVFLKWFSGTVSPQRCLYKPSALKPLLTVYLAQSGVRILFLENISFPLCDTKTLIRYHATVLHDVEISQIRIIQKYWRWCIVRGSKSMKFFRWRDLNALRCAPCIFKWLVKWLHRRVIASAGWICSTNDSCTMFKCSIFGLHFLYRTQWTSEQFRNHAAAICLNLISWKYLPPDVAKQTSYKLSRNGFAWREHFENSNVSNILTLVHAFGGMTHALLLCDFVGLLFCLC